MSWSPLKCAGVEYFSIEAMGRDELEKGILEYSSIVTCMKDRLNSLTSRVPLPPELLSEIFLHYVELMLGPTHRAGGLPNRPYSWLAITYVCHHWRQVALRTSAMWKNISVTSSPDCTREMLSRSKQAQLVIRAANPNTPSRLDSIRAMLKEFQRFHSVQLQMPDFIFGQIADLAPVSAPHLTSIILYPGLNTSMPTFFDKCDMPILHTLEIYTFRFPIIWSSPLFQPTLTRLVLVFQFTFTPESLDALQTLPALRHLDVSGTFELDEPNPNGFGTSPVITKCITLPKLEYIRATGMPGQSITFLESIRFPATATISLCFPDAFTDNIGDGGLRLIPKLERLAAATPGQTFRSLALWKDRVGGDHMYFDLWTKILPVEKLDGRNHIPQFRMIYPASQDLAQVLLDEIVPALPLSDVESLYLGDIRGDGSMDWTQLFREMHNVSALRVTGYASCIPRMLMKRTEIRRAVAGGRPVTQRIMPRLRTLVIQEMHVEYAEGIAEDTFADDLLRVLKARNKSHSPIRRLVLTDCVNLFAADVDALRQFVKHVSWDYMEWPDSDVDPDDYTDEDLYSLRWDMGPRGIPAILGLEI